MAVCGNRTKVRALPRAGPAQAKLKRSPGPCANIRSYGRCLHLPRFELVLAAGGARALVGRALAIAPPSGSEQRLGEVSGAAEAHGVRRGMALGEALAQLPRPGPRPCRSGRGGGVLESLLRSLEAIGAAVESPRAGLAHFETGPLRSPARRRYPR